MIESEQGCDQSRLAKTLHETGSRSQYKFHHVDCKRIELENKRDLFLDLLEKKNGTLFIENVDCLNWGDQIELLNFLKSGIDNNTKPSKYFRIINEVPTIILIVVVFLVIFKPL